MMPMSIIGSAFIFGGFILADAHFGSRTREASW
jgi:hypothetical protein